MNQKKFFIVLLFLLSLVNVHATQYKYRLECLDNIYVYTDCQNKKFVYPNKEYRFVIKTNSGVQGSGVGKFKITVTNGTASKTEEIQENETIKVSWTDIADSAKIRISDKKPHSTSDELIAGSPIEFSYKIASLKGQTPNMTLGAESNPPMGTNPTLYSALFDPVIYPGIKIKNNLGFTYELTATSYEWTLPEGWRTTRGESGTFIVCEDNKNITIITDYFSTGEVKVRAMNTFLTAGSEYKTYVIDRGFNFLSYPQSITVGDASAKTFSVTSFSGVTYEWTAPDGWSINGGSNTITDVGLNSVNITPNSCTPSDGKIQVKLKKGDQVSKAFVFPYLGVVKPTFELTNAEIYQFEEVSFSLNNIIMSNIQSVSVIGDGVMTSNDKLIFTKSGKIKISVSILTNGCNEPLIITSNVNVKPLRLTISGPSTIYERASYTITNYHLTAAVQWSVTPSYVAPTIINQGLPAINIVNHYGLDGSSTIATLNAVITIGGQQFTLTKNIVFGWAVIDIEKSRLDLRPGEYILEAKTTNDANNSMTVSWSVQGPSAALIDFPYPYDAGYADKSARLKMLEVYEPGYYTVCAAASDGVYSTQTYCKSFYIDDYKPADGYFSMFPNPAAGIVNIRLNDSANQRTQTNYRIQTCQIQLWNSLGLIKQVQTDQTEYQLDLSGLSPGFYYVHMIKDGETYRKQLIVK